MLNPDDMDGSISSYKRGIRKAREWCCFNGKKVDISEYFGQGAEVFTTPGKGTLHLTYKYNEHELTFSISGQDL